MILKITQNGIHSYCSTIERLCRRTLGSNPGLLQNWTDFFTTNRPLLLLRFEIESGSSPAPDSVLINVTFNKQKFLFEMLPGTVHTFTVLLFHVHQKPNSWCTISLRFLGIILRVLRLEVSVWISQSIGKGVPCLRFSVKFCSFLLYNGTVETVRGCVSLKKYKSRCKTVEVSVNSKDLVQEFRLRTSVFATSTSERLSLVNYSAKRTGC